RPRPSCRRLRLRRSVLSAPSRCVVQRAGLSWPLAPRRLRPRSSPRHGRPRALRQDPARPSPEDGRGPVGAPERRSRARARPPRVARPRLKHAVATSVCGLGGHFVARPCATIPTMRSREERLSVGGIDVQVWTGGQGDPLLVLHGAGGNRGWTRWMDRAAERFTIWAPTHPGFGASGDADWMETIEDLARFHLWLIDAAKLGRPHLLGQSIGGWTAAEMATMSPGSIDKLILVAPVGIKPERGEILDLFYYPPPQLLGMTVHDPKTIPEWDALFGSPPTPAQLDILARNREMTARLTWKPYMHNPRLPYFLPRVSNP